MESGAVDPSIDANGYANIQSEWADMELENSEMSRFIKTTTGVGQNLEEQRTLADLIMAKIREKEEKKVSGGVEKEVRLSRISITEVSFNMSIFMCSI